MQKELFDFLEAVMPVASTFMLGLFLHKREMKKIKVSMSKVEESERKAKIEAHLKDKQSSYIPRIMTLRNSVEIKEAVDEIYKHTKATRFLILIAVNGKHDLNSVSCIWYHYRNQEDDVNPAKSYSNVDITEDVFYKGMLKHIAKYQHDFFNINVLKMPQSVLKDIYYEEQITHSKVGFLSRAKIDDENDMLTFFSCSTDADDDNGFTQREKNKIKLIVNGTIKPSMEQIQK